MASKIRDLADRVNNAKRRSPYLRGVQDALEAALFYIEHRDHEALYNLEETINFEIKRIEKED